jgi:hypothetical protein
MQGKLYRTLKEMSDVGCDDVGFEREYINPTSDIEKSDIISVFPQSHAPHSRLAFEYVTGRLR